MHEGIAIQLNKRISELSKNRRIRDKVRFNTIPVVPKDIGGIFWLTLELYGRQHCKYEQHSMVFKWTEIYYLRLHMKGHQKVSSRQTRITLQSTPRRSYRGKQQEFLLKILPYEVCQKSLAQSFLHPRQNCRGSLVKKWFEL